MIAVLESTSRLERLTDEIVSFVDRDDDVIAEQVDDLHDRLQREFSAWTRGLRS
jgi:hypothetical protein